MQGSNGLVSFDKEMLVGHRRTYNYSLLNLQRRKLIAFPFYNTSINTQLRLFVFYSCDIVAAEASICFRTRKSSKSHKKNLFLLLTVVLVYGASKAFNRHIQLETPSTNVNELAIAVQICDHSKTHS